ncbi:MAG TPA: hypothetical protein VF121_17525 [Thermoanaerobaculia bacterium]|nr:hypothetical protein [Thermoanaerobaculia bacterium]
MRWLFRLGAALTLGLAAAALARLPFANGPTEWEWPWRPPEAAGWRLAAAAALALALVAVAWAGAAGRIRARAALALLVPLGWLFTMALAVATPAGFGRLAASLASRHSFGYVWDAALAPPSGELLADYPRASRRLEQHARTHPPGAILAVRGVDAVGRRLERLAGAGERGLLATAERALARERQRAVDRRRPAPVRLPSPWTVVLLAGLLPALSAAAALPLHALALRLGLAPGAALGAAALWTLVPARSLFTPSLDQALPLLLVGAAALAAGEGWAGKLAAGTLLGLAGLTSYGALAVAPLVAAAAWWSGDGRRAVLPLAAGFAVPWTALTLLAGYDPWISFAAAMEAHRAIAVAPRGYLTWLLWNPYDFALLLGPAVALPALGALAVRGPLRAIAALFWATLALLLVSGGVRGEVGRIWLPFMPWACLLAAAVLTRDEAPAGRSVFALQALLACVLAATMVFVE